MTFNVLEPSLNPFASRFLEASAGTGKTFAIEHVVARLLIEGKSPLLLEEILVVTFTRAATRDLKFRIHRNLQKIQEEILSDAITLDYVRRQIELQGRQVISSRIEKALLSYEQSAIWTLHGFCFRMLKEFSLEAGYTAFAQQGEGELSQVVIEEWIESLLKGKTFLEPYSPFQLQKLLKAHQRKPKKWIAELAKLFASPHTILPSPSYQELLDCFNQALVQLGPLSSEKIEQDLTYLASHYTKLKNVEQGIELLKETLTSLPCTQEGFDRWLEEESLLEKMIPENLKKRGPPLDRNRLHYPGLLEKIQQKLLPLGQQAKDVPTLMLQLASSLQEKGASFFEESGFFSPDQLLVKMQQALASALFVQKIQARFKAAIIDEFQDTDPVQWSIIRTIFSDPPSILYLVGDPKQSIYAFRNADLYVYLDAKQKMGEDNLFQLDTNYRSTPALIDALNTLFRKAGPDWMALPSQQRSLEVAEVKAGASVLPLAKGAPVVCMLASCKKGRSRRFPTTAFLHSHIFPYIAEEILSLHTDEKIPFHKIAILIKDRFQGQELLEYFKQCQLPACMQRGSLITETEAYLSLKEIMRALYHPERLSLVKAALATPLLGWRAVELSVPNTDPALLREKERFQKLQTLLFKEGFGPLFHALFGNTNCPDLLRLLEIILVEEHNIQGKYLEYLERLEFDAHPDNPLFQVSSKEGKEAIQILTMHRSKGLEFEIVFALGLSNRSSVPSIFKVQQEKGTILSSSPCEKALLEIDAEKMRLLYVALTRAKQKVYIPFVIDEENPGERGESAPAELFLTHLLKDTISCEKALQWFASFVPHIQVDLLEEKQPPLYTPPHEPPSPPCPTPPLFIPRPVLSFSSLAHPTPSISVVQEESFSIHSMPKGPLTGTLIHHLFEQIFKKGLHHPLSVKQIEQLIVYELKGTLLEPWTPLIPSWIERLLKKRVQDFSLSDIPSSQLFYETPFLYSCKQGLMKGFADLFFSFKERYYILDWKTNVLENYTQEAMKKAIEEHEYDLQAMIYKEALKSYVKLFDTRPFESCFGGALYYFVRGEACHVISL